MKLPEELSERSAYTIFGVIAVGMALLAIFAVAEDKYSGSKLKPIPSAAEQASVKRTWFVADIDDSHCFESEGGPAKLIESLKLARPEADESYVTDQGMRRLNKVRVSITEGDRMQYQDFYTSLEACEYEKVNVNKRLADRYR